MEAIIDYRGKTPKKTTHGVPLVTAKIVKNGWIDTPSEFIAESDYSSWMTRGLPREGDVVVTTEAPLGEVAQLGNQKVALAQRIITLRGKPGVLDNTFLKFLMRSTYVQGQMFARASGSTVSGIKQSELRKVTLHFPDITEQHKIAFILGSLDDKIALNRKISATLEAVARALFKSWFIDFDPVRAKAEGRDSGLPPETAGLFPDSFEEIESGEVPTGWNHVSLIDVAEVNPATSLAGIAEAPYLDMANVPTQGHAVNTVIVRAVSSGSRFRRGDTLLARITPCLENGKTAFVDFLAEGVVGWGSTEFVVIRPRDPMPKEYAYLLARSDAFRAYAIGKMTGTSGRQRVPVDSVAAYPVVQPSATVCATFASVVQPIFLRMSAASGESRTLASLRDALLPKLISGEIRITDGERALEESA
jgi:type I restriction enzyme S subunit